ncbi:MAG: high-affinity nickel-transporter [Mycobacterium sp.]|jgi:high-affinity nickel-transport protein|nr:high-affinity nickel-transporter [Mycobacterium sp.]
MADGGKPKSVGFWFAMSHSMMELVVAVLVIAGTHAVGALLDDDSPPDMPWAWPAH